MSSHAALHPLDCLRCRHRFEHTSSSMEVITKFWKLDPAERTTMGSNALYSISSLTGVVDFTNSEPNEAFRRPWRVFSTSILVVGFVMFLEGQLDASRRFLFHRLDRSRFWLCFWRVSAVDTHYSSPLHTLLAIQATIRRTTDRKRREASGMYDQRSLSPCAFDFCPEPEIGVG